MNTIRVSNRLDPDQAQQFFGPDLGPNSLQTLSADGTSRPRVNLTSGLAHWKSTFHNHGMYHDF